jgi:hypothetical protein
MMVVVDTSVWDEQTHSAPDWADGVDGSQCGLYRGKWVAYDYALELIRFREKIEKKWGTKSVFFHEEIISGW